MATASNSSSYADGIEMQETAEERRRRITVVEDNTKSNNRRSWIGLMSAGVTGVTLIVLLVLAIHQLQSDNEDLKKRLAELETLVSRDTDGTGSPLSKLNSRLVNVEVEAATLGGILGTEATDGNTISKLQRDLAIANDKISNLEGGNTALFRAFVDAEMDKLILTFGYGQESNDAESAFLSMATALGDVKDVTDALATYGSKADIDAGIDEKLAAYQLADDNFPAGVVQFRHLAAAVSSDVADGVAARAVTEELGMFSSSARIQSAIDAVSITDANIADGALNGTKLAPGSVVGSRLDSSSIELAECAQIYTSENNNNTNYANVIEQLEAVPEILSAVASAVPGDMLSWMASGGFEYQGTHNMMGKVQYRASDDTWQLFAYLDPSAGVTSLQQLGLISPRQFQVYMCVQLRSLKITS